MTDTVRPPLGVKQTATRGHLAASAPTEIAAPMADMAAMLRSGLEARQLQALEPPAPLPACLTVFASATG